MILTLTVILITILIKNNHWLEPLSPRSPCTTVQQLPPQCGWEAVLHNVYGIAWVSDFALQLHLSWPLSYYSSPSPNYGSVHTVCVCVCVCVCCGRGGGGLQYESDKGINGANNLILEFFIINGYTSCKHV